MEFNDPRGRAGGGCKESELGLKKRVKVNTKKDIILIREVSREEKL